MSIAWNYLDKRSGTVQAIKDFSSMKFIIDSTDSTIKNVYDGMSGVGSPNMDGMPRSHDPKAGEGRIVSGIDEIDVLKERYRQAVEYMAWFVPAWEQLSEDEQFLLTTFYEHEEYSMVSPVDIICQTYNIERSTAYNRKNKALNHLMTLLFGKR